LAGLDCTGNWERSPKIAPASASTPLTLFGPHATPANHRRPPRSSRPCQLRRAWLAKDYRPLLRRAKRQIPEVCKWPVIFGTLMRPRSKIQTLTSTKGKVRPLRSCSSSSSRPAYADQETLIHHKSVGSKLPNHHADAVSAFYQPALVRECHPVRPARQGRAALTQLPDLF
jgi:hypothetical protein